MPPFLTVFPGVIETMSEVERLRIAEELRALKKHSAAPTCVRFSKHDDATQPTHVELVDMHALNNALCWGRRHSSKLMIVLRVMSFRIHTEWFAETRVVPVFGVLLNGFMDGQHVALSINFLIELFSDKDARSAFQRQIDEACAKVASDDVCTTHSQESNG
jgi:hypothetical protein